MNMRSHYLKKFIFGFYFCIALMFGNAAYAQYPGFADPGSRSASGGEGGDFVAVSSSVDGGSIPIGATAQVVVRFRNDSAKPIQTGLIRLYPSSTVSAEVSLNQCNESELPIGAECAIALSVKSLQAGPWRVEMLMSHSGRTRLVTATLSGTVDAGAEGSTKLTSDVEAIPNELNFGDLKDSQTLVEPVILRNITSQPIEIKSIYIDTSEQAGYSLKADCKSLAAGQACIAVVSWSPKLQGRSSGVLVVEHSGPAALASVPLKGQYAPGEATEAEVFPKAVPGRGLLISSQTELDFGAEVDTASTLTVSLVNAGDTDVHIKDIRMAGSDNGLGFKEDGCNDNTILKPIEACPLTITWSPTRVGSVLDDVQVVHDGARGILVLPVRGSATATVSKDQKAIVLSGTTIIQDSFGASGMTQEQSDAANRNREMVSAPAKPAAVNPAGALDGYRISSFSPTRAIINGPGGSRLVFDNEEIVLGGIPWFVMIQQNGIEFLHQGQRILLLFDRSLSSIERGSTSSSSGSSSSNNSGDNG